MKRALSSIVAIVGKDLRIEWRTKDIVLTMVLFAVVLVVIFSFSLTDESLSRHAAAGGVLWVSILFCGSLGLGRIFEREREGETLRALLMLPTSRGLLYLAKLSSTLIYIVATELLIVPLVLLLFDLQPARPALFVLLLFGGTLGFAALGSLFAASLMRAGGRDVLLAILTYPLVTPIVIAGTKGTAALLGSPPEPQTAIAWLKLIVAFDVTFVTLSLWTFGPLVASD